MSKIYKLFSAIMTLLALFGVLSAQTIEIGTGTSTTSRPMPGLWGWQYDVYLYTPSDAVELNSSLTLTGVEYNISSNSTSTGAQLTIWMKDVDANYSLDANTTFATYTSGATQVYRNTALSTTAGWNTFNFSSDFQHTAGKAILIAVFGKGCTTSGGCSRSCYYTSVSNRHWSKYADSSDPGTSVSGSLDANLVNVRLLRYCVARTGTFEFRNGTTPVTSTINHLIGSTFTPPTLVNNITPAGTPAYTSSNTSVATVNATTGAVTFTGQEGFVTITAYVQASGTYCEKMASYTINVNNGCVKIGNGTSTTYVTPLNNNYNYSLTEMIYLADEIGYPSGGTIDRIGFQYAYGTAMTAKNNVKIYMANTNRSAFASGAVSEFINTGLELVYSGPLNCSGNGVWNYFNLSSPFDYDGGNLLVVVDDNSGSYNSSSYVFNYTTTTGYTVWRYQSDGTYYSVNTISNYSSSCTYSTSRVNTAFCISEACTHRTGTFAFDGPASYTYVIGSGDFAEPNLSANLTPGNGTITYESSNTAVATVDANGNVTFTGVEGRVTITAVSEMAGYCKERARYTIEAGDGCRKIGTGTSTTSASPLYGYYKNSYDQMIYTAEEIGTPGLITAIGFNAYSSNSVARAVDIYIGETTASTFSSTADWVPASDLQLVYSGTWNIVAGWNVIQLTAPFTYSGINNLVVAVDCGATSTASSSFYYTSTTGSTVLYSYSDTYDAIPATIGSYSGSKSTTSSRPNIKICIEPCDTRPVNFGFSNSMVMCYLGGQPNVTLNRDGNNGVLTWSSSDPSVATVDENGIITTHSLGTTTISVFAPVDGDVCSASDSYELQVICPAHIPSTQAISICTPQAVDLTATVRDDEGNLQLQWFDDVLADSPIYTGDTYHTNVSATTTYYVAAYNTDQHCYSSRVPATVHVFDVQYDATTSTVSGYVGVPMYGYPPEGSHEGATFTANGMPTWLTLNSDGSFTGTPTAAGSGSFTITATNAMGCTVTRTINWTVMANNLGCCDFESFYIYQDNKPFPLHLADDGYYYADVCLNTAMTLRVQKLNNCSGNYSYTWRLTSSTGGLIQEFTGTQFTYTYDRTAGYGVMLQIRRNNSDCISIPVRVRVAGVFQVATRPSFNLCHGEPFNIYVSTDGVGAIDVVRPSGGAATTLGVSDTILLPDGEPCNGNCFYRSSVTFSDFSAGATIRNANDLLYVMLNIEHTFIGDIYIAITCPSGRRSVILSQCGSGSATCHAQIPSGYDTWVSGVGTSNHGANFGNPNSGNSSSCDPNASGNELGIGWNYIWSENTSRGYTYAGGTGLIYDDANVHNSTVDSSDLANMSQIYVPQETFNNLIGCPLNGTWSIEVVDGWGGDNGHIFNWELGLNEELLPDSWSYTVDLDSSWVTCGWNSTKSGVYMEITPPDNFDGTSSCDLFLRDEYGCVSTYENIVTVTMNPTVHSELVVDGGQCEPYTWARNNQTYTASGTYVDAGLTPQGCPDTATLILTVAGSVFDTVSAQSCESYTWDATGQTYTQSGTYTANLVTAMGCDSIITLNLTISNEITVPHDTVICPDNFPLNDWYGDWGDFAAAGSLQQHFTTANGCDSLVVLTVQAYPKPDVSLPAPPGAGGCPLTAGSYVITPTITNAQAPYSYNWTGDYVGATPTASIPASVTCGTFTETLYLTDANGCMDTATVTFSAVDDVAPYFLNDMPDYSEVSAVAMGQDCRFRIPDIVGILQPADNCGVSEMVQLPLPPNDITEPTTVEVIVTDRCGLQTRRYITVTVPDPLSANELAHTNVSCAGRCDGTVTLSGVTGGSPQYHYSWSSSGTGATNVSSQTGTTLSNLAPGIYTVTITDDAECSIQKSVTIGIDGEASTNVESFTACDSFTWHGTTYTQSNNTATYTTTNAEGCDSTVTLNLTVNHSSSGIDSHTECDSYTWPMNSQTYTSSTSSPSVPAGLNSVGCDSTVTLHLTINRSTTGTDVHTACDSYTWPLNGQTYTSSTNSPQVVITNRAGCDSTVTLRLTINNTRYGSYVDTVCYGEQLTYRGNRYPAGQHTVTITSAAGCDSVVALQVVARPQLSVTIEEYHSCELGHYQLTGSVSGSNNVSYRWTAQPSDPDVETQRDDLEISVNPSRSTDYTLTAGYGAGRICAASQTISLSPLRLPVADITFNPPFLTCDDLEWTAHSASQNAESISWYVNDIEAGIDENISGAAQCDDDSVRISIVAVNSICTDVHDTVIYLRKSQLWFPNVFTPNLNINKTFAPIGHGIVEYEIYIYTREGLLVFHSTTLEEGWRGDHNGVECPRATYTYIARFRNEIEPDVWHKQIGTVTLLR
jgi:subtilisin-like proprotein convertase family protein